MSIRKSLAAVLCALAVILPAAARTADPNSLDEVIKRVQAQQKNTNSLEADFRQEKTLALLAKPEVSTGHFVYQKPNSVLWTYDAPKRVTMLIADGMLTTYYPDLKKAEKIEVKRFQDRIFKYMGATGAIDELSRYFDFTFTNKPSDPAYLLDLKPKTGAVAKRVQNIKLWIDKKTYLTTRIQYTEGDGDVTKYEFTHLRVNEPVAQSRFVLNLPATVHVEQMNLQ
jgi:outer membrane lipoprotein-sorting protein